MDHVRIDEGVKRGKRKKYPPVKTDPKTGQFLPTLPTDPEVIKSVLTDYARGATFQHLAERYGVSRQAVYSWMLGKLGPIELDSLVVRALTARIANGDTLLEEGATPLDVTRGREMARFARMDLERLRPEIYGQKQEITHHVTDLGDKLRRARERTVIDVTPEQQVAPQQLAVTTVSDTQQVITTDNTVAHQDIAR